VLTVITARLYFQIPEVAYITINAYIKQDISSIRVKTRTHVPPRKCNLESFAVHNTAARIQLKTKKQTIKKANCKYYNTLTPSMHNVSSYFSQNNAILM
jgi:hypothetical protein